MTLSEMLADCYQKLDYATSPQTAVTTRLTGLLNETLAEVVSEPGIGAWIARQTPPLVVASVANQAVYAIPSPGLDRIDAITDRTNDRRLDMRTFDWYRHVEPDPAANTGTPEAWVPMGFSAVLKQPSNASQLFLDSTAAGDTQVATITAMMSDGHVRTITATLTGTTGVTLSATHTTIVQVQRFTLASAAVGTVTLTEDAEGGTILATIPIGKSHSRYTQFALWPTPSAAVDYYLDGDWQPATLSVTTDEPPLPGRFHRVLVDGALWREFVKRDDTRADYQRQAYRKGLSDLRYYLTCPPDFLPTKGAGTMERSRYGAYYPATRW